LTVRIAALLFALASATASAQEPSALAERAAARFPQPVRAGDLPGRDVVQPIEAQHLLGRVAGIVRGADGALLMVIDAGGTFSLGSRRVAVPLAAVALSGKLVDLMDVTPAALAALPPFDPAGTEPVPPGTQIDVGIVGPFH
jgi:hypothetical protein